MFCSHCSHAYRPLIPSNPFITDHSPAEVAALARVLVRHPELDANKDGRVSGDEFCAAIRRVQRKWQKAKVDPARESWKP